MSEQARESGRDSEEVRECSLFLHMYSSINNLGISLFFLVTDENRTNNKTKKRNGDNKTLFSLDNLITNIKNNQTKKTNV